MVLLAWLDLGAWWDQTKERCCPGSLSFFWFRQSRPFRCKDVLTVSFSVSCSGSMSWCPRAGSRRRRGWRWRLSDPHLELPRGVELASLAQVRSGAVPLPVVVPEVQASPRSGTPLLVQGVEEGQATTSWISRLPSPHNSGQHLPSSPTTERRAASCWLHCFPSFLGPMRARVHHVTGTYTPFLLGAGRHNQKLPSKSVWVYFGKIMCTHFWSMKMLEPLVQQRD
jgi:hypothetical protein